MTPPPAGTTAGALLRAAREKQGLHIAALAASIKVPVAKLEALEADRYDQLLDAAFIRALAQAVCRALRTDPQPVLALLPQTDGSALDHVVGNLNTPFRERSGPELPNVNLGAVKPMAWAGGALLVAAAVVYFLPSGALQPAEPAATESLATSESLAASQPVSVPAPPPSEATLADVLPSPASAAQPAAPVASAVVVPPVLLAAAAASTSVRAAMDAVREQRAAEPAASVPVAASLVQLRAEQASWIEAYDGQGQVLFSRLLNAGETAGFEGRLPIRLKIGNAPGTHLSFRGKPVDLAPLTRNAVARVELQ
ncbi:helix-turn-helix domain-containing protein [Rubrivivax gelatinosus]|uniref:helix-turn-helix domain-containing protein n=1 Tax=Rubrivivax gelatinosus TaxID=28068 RepID=UPI001FB2FBD0|nr:helix-turn-helix domain-containing protein [Rubrivivax gelatinosus]